MWNLCVVHLLCIWRLCSRYSFLEADLVHKINSKIWENENIEAQKNKARSLYVSN